MNETHCSVHSFDLPPWVEGERRTGTALIQGCAAHRAPLCGCWAGVRARLQRAAQLFPGDSPEARAALELMAEFEWLESLPRALRHIARN